MKVKTGKHELSFAKRGDKSTSGSVTFEIDDDSTFKCVIKSHETYIEVMSPQKLDYLESTKAKMPDVTELRLDQAVEMLTEAGFVNLYTSSSKTIILRSNWVVVKQNIKPGKKVNRTTKIVLTCEKD